MSGTRVSPVALVDLRDQVAELRAEMKELKQRQSLNEAAYTETGRQQRIIIGKLEEVLDSLKRVFPDAHKRRHG